MRILMTFLALVPLVVQAQTDLLTGDRALTRQEVVDLTARDALRFYEGGTSHYGPGTDYSYTYASGLSAKGDYSIDQDGLVCIAFDNGFGRCDRFVESHGRIVMITEEGERYPIRP
jgi:hypothetical protein